MNRSDITELYYIAPIATVPSIMQHGILSHKLAERLPHHSVAMLKIQERRKNKQIPGAKPLHDYANLYFDAHNPMLSKIREKNDIICVLRIESVVLDLPGVIITDMNAAADMARFLPMVEGLNMLNPVRLFARYWTHPEDEYDERRHKAEKCAEILVPDRVDSCFLTGAYVANQTALLQFMELKIKLPVCIKDDIFF